MSLLWQLASQGRLPFCRSSGAWPLRVAVVSCHSGTNTLRLTSTSLRLFSSTVAWRLDNVGAKQFGGVSTWSIKRSSPPGQLFIVPLRLFRWDAKPDNQFGHSFPQGMEAPAHPTFWILILVFAVLMINWRSVREYVGFSFLPEFIENFLEHKSGSSNSKDAKDFGGIPSSLAADIYDKYGPEGVDAMIAAWERVKNLDQSQDKKIMHAIMMASAASRYKKEVAEEEERLGLAPESQQNMVEGKEEKAVSGPRPLLERLNVQAEEMAVHPEILEEEEGEEKQKEKIGFRNRKIIEYENRIRQYSTPDKVFRYFATYKVVDEKGNSEVMMTPEDFLRSLVPGEKQPEHLGLDHHIQVSVGEVGQIALLRHLEDGSVFHQLGAGGLISFSDYIFLLTVLSTSRRHFRIAFKMFDLNGDGTIEADEFEKVTNLLRTSSSTGARHRDHQTTGNTFKGVNSGLITYFFGEKRRGSLTVDRFLEFQRHLQNEILALEFRRKDPGNSGHISEKDFASVLIAYAGFSPKERSRMLKRVRRAYEEGTSPGISLRDYLNFYQVLYSINDIDTALTYHTIAGAPIERATMKHVARTVARVELSDHLLDVVFTLFDANGDGKLSNKEFVSVMKQRAMRGLEKPKEIGISRVFNSIFKCAADCRPAVMGGTKRTE